MSDRKRVAEAPVEVPTCLEPPPSKRTKKEEDASEEDASEEDAVVPSSPTAEKDGTVIVVSYSDESLATLEYYSVPKQMIEHLIKVMDDAGGDTTVLESADADVTANRQYVVKEQGYGHPTLWEDLGLSKWGVFVDDDSPEAFGVGSGTGTTVTPVFSEGSCIDIVLHLISFG